MKKTYLPALLAAFLLAFGFAAFAQSPTGADPFDAELGAGQSSFTAAPADGGPAHDHGAHLHAAGACEPGKKCGDACSCQGKDGKPCRQDGKCTEGCACTAESCSGAGCCGQGDGAQGDAKAGSCEGHHGEGGAMACENGKCGQCCKDGKCADCCKDAENCKKCCGDDAKDCCAGGHEGHDGHGGHGEHAGHDGHGAGHGGQQG